MKHWRGFNRAGRNEVPDCPHHQLVLLPAILTTLAVQVVLTVQRVDVLLLGLWTFDLSSFQVGEDLRCLLRCVLLIRLLVVLLRILLEVGSSCPKDDGGLGHRRRRGKIAQREKRGDPRLDLALELGRFALQVGHRKARLRK